MLNIVYERDAIGEISIKKNYDSISEIEGAIASEYETCFIVISQKISKNEELIMGLEISPGTNELCYGFYIYDDEYLPWMEQEVNLSDFKSMDELLDDMENRFKYAYVTAMHESLMYGDDEEDDEEEEENKNEEATKMLNIKEKFMKEMAQNEMEECKMSNNQNILKLTQKQIIEVTSELKTILDNQYKTERQEKIEGLEFICHMPGIDSERTWLFSYKGALVLLYDLGNNYYSYVDCMNIKIDNIVKKYAIVQPKDSIQRDMAFTDLKYDLEKIKSVKFGGFITVGDLAVRDQLEKEEELSRGTVKTNEEKDIVVYKCFDTIEEMNNYFTSEEIKEEDGDYYIEILRIESSEEDKPYVVVFETTPNEYPKMTISSYIGNSTGLMIASESFDYISNYRSIEQIEKRCTEEYMKFKINCEAEKNGEYIIYNRKEN